VRRWLGYGLLALVLAGMHVALTPYAFDDAYIHLRIAQHLVEHGEPYFHLGQPLRASSSSGWTLVLAGLIALFGPSLRILAVLQALVTTAAAAIFARLARGAVGPEARGLEPAVAAVTVAVLLAPSLGLMETPATLALVGGGYLLLQRGRASGLALLAAASFFRIEAVVFLLAALALNLVRRELSWWRSLIAAVLGGAPFLAYDLWFFGTILPHAARAKRLAYDLPFTDSIATAGPSLHSGHVLEKAAYLAMLLAALGILALAVRLGERLRPGPPRDPGLWALTFVGAGVAILGTYLAARTFVFPWYMPLYLLPGALGALWLGWQRRGLATGVMTAILLFPFARDAVGYAAGAAASPARMPLFVEQARVGQYLDIGATLDRVCPTCDLLTTEIGGLGWSFHGRIRDGMGLVSPEALRWHPMKIPEERRASVVGAVPVGFAREVHPGLVVSADIFMMALLRSDALAGYEQWACPIFNERDRQLTDLPGPWGAVVLHVFARRDVAAAHPELGKLLVHRHRCRHMVGEPDQLLLPVRTWIQDSPAKRIQSNPALRARRSTSPPRRP
jgi:hypothetical protein